MTQTGLLFGSFNPIHIGHLALANYMLEYAPFDEIWLVVSPRNPFKNESDLAPPAHRLAMAHIATRKDLRIRISDIEFEMPTPSYTIHTLEKLITIFPGKKFSLIIGSDNLLNIERWQASEKILKTFPILVYPRPGYSLNEANADILQSVKTLQAPLLDISSTLIREGIRNGKNLRYLMPDGVYDYIVDKQLY